MINVGDKVELMTSEVGHVKDAYVIVESNAIREMIDLEVNGRIVTVPMWSATKVRG